VPAAAAAHTLGTGGVGLVDGLAHPLVGIDHLLAALAVGWWAAQGECRWLFLVPAAFAVAMTGGVALALAGVALPHVEAGVVASLLVFGVLVAFAIRLPAQAGVVLIGAFAVFHGHAHGGATPAAAAPALYVLGLLGATGALHVAGVATHLIARRGWLTRAAGAATAAAGAIFALA